jgi:hypothetical protein
VHDGVALMVHAHGNAPVLDRLLEGVPHLPRAKSWVPELLDQSGRRRAAQAHHRLHRMPEGEVLDPLCGPFRTNLGAGHPPHLLRVAPKEALVEAAPEPCDNPVFEGLGAPTRAQASGEVRECAAERFGEPELAHDILRLERIVEVLSAVVDAREARARQELVAEHPLPEPLDRFQLGVEAVAAKIDPVAAELDGLRDATDDSVRLEDGSLDPPAGKNVRRGEAGRACAEDGDPS